MNCKFLCTLFGNIGQKGSQIFAFAFRGVLFSVSEGNRSYVLCIGVLKSLTRILISWLRYTAFSGSTLFSSRSHLFGTLVKPFILLFSWLEGNAIY